MMSTSAKTSWRIAGECFGGCNCAWGCPCQFNALPTHGCCEGVGCWHIRDGQHRIPARHGGRQADLSAHQLLRPNECVRLEQRVRF